VDNFVGNLVLMACEAAPMRHHNTLMIFCAIKNTMKSMGCTYSRGFRHGFAETSFFSPARALLWSTALQQLGAGRISAGFSAHV